MPLRHPHGGTGTRSPTRTAAAAGAMMTLLAVASVATRRGGGTTAPPGTDAVAAAGHHLAAVGLLVAAPIVAVAGGTLFLYAQIARRRELDPAIRRRFATARIRTYVTAALGLSLLVYYLRTGHNPIAFLHLRNPFGHHAAAGHAAAPAGHPHGGSHSALTTADWTLAAIAWLALLALAAVVVLRVRSTRPRGMPAELPEAAEAAAEPDLDTVRRERDPRRAVIAAYAAMERVMALRGLPRGAHEAPMEYLGRVTLRGHERVAAVHRLTSLFQWARFSRRPVDDDMRRRAIAAVEELAGDDGGPA